LYEKELNMETETLWAIAYGAVVVESIVNIVRNIEEKNKCWKYWGALALSLVLGVLVAYTFDIDLFKVVGLEARIPFVGGVLTGLIMSRGSNIVNDVLERLNAWKPKA
jgi:hypothetical protein